jgi:hypothetical protein
VTRAEALSALRSLASSIVAAVEGAGPCGVAGGTIFAALSQHGCTLEHFEVLMDAMVDVGRLEKAGQHYRVPRGYGRQQVALPL